MVILQYTTLERRHLNDETADFLLERAGEGAPEIDGSERGFIGLVVALGVLIIICSVSVFFLLRYRQAGGRGRGHVSHFKNMRRSSEDGWVESLKWNLRRLKAKVLTKGGGDEEEGWIRQNDMEGDLGSDSEDGHSRGGRRRNMDIHLDDAQSITTNQISMDETSTTTSRMPGYPNVPPYNPRHQDSMSSVSTVVLSAPGGGPTPTNASLSTRSLSDPPLPDGLPKIDTTDARSKFIQNSPPMTPSSGSKFHEHI